MRAEAVEPSSDGEVGRDGQGDAVAEAIGGGGDGKYNRLLGWPVLTRAQWAALRDLVELWQAAPRRSCARPGLLMVAAGDPSEEGFAQLLVRLDGLADELGLEIRVFPTSGRFPGLPASAAPVVKPLPLFAGLGASAVKSPALPSWIALPQTRRADLIAAGKSLLGTPIPGGRLFAFGADVTGLVKAQNPRLFSEEIWNQLALVGAELGAQVGDRPTADDKWMDLANRQSRRIDKLAGDLGWTLDKGYERTLVWKRGAWEELARRDAFYALVRTLPSLNIPDARFAVLVATDPNLPETQAILERVRGQAASHQAEVWELPVPGSRCESLASGSGDSPGNGASKDQESILGLALDLGEDVLICSQVGQCRAAQVGTLVYFAKVLGIEGFGPEVVSALVEADLLHRREDFFKLDAARIAALERMGELSARRLLEQVDRVREIPLALFLESLGIPDLAKDMSTKLEWLCGTLEAVLALDEEQLLMDSRVSGVDFTTAVTVIGGLRRERQAIDALAQHVRVLQGARPPVGAESAGPLAGKSFVFTGRLRVTRSEAQVSVRAAGGATPDSVTKDLDYLVEGTEDDGRLSSKSVKARTLIQQGKAKTLKILTETEFWSLLEGQ